MFTDISTDWIIHSIIITTISFPSGCIQDALSALLRRLGIVDSAFFTFNSYLQQGTVPVHCPVVVTLACCWMTIPFLPTVIVYSSLGTLTKT